MRSPTVIIIALLLCCGGFYGWWSHQASMLETLTKANIEQMQASFKKQGGWMALKYDGIETSGFPTLPSAHIIKPCLHYNQPSMRVLDLCADRLTIKTENVGLNQFRITLPTNATGQEVWQNGLFHRYSITATNTPSILMRLPAAELSEGKAPAAFSGFAKVTPQATLEALPKELAHQYALHFPEHIQLSITQDEKTRTTSFNPPNSPIILWRPVLYKLNDVTDLFFHLMAEIAQNGKVEMMDHLPR